MRKLLPVWTIAALLAAPTAVLAQAAPSPAAPAAPAAPTLDKVLEASGISLSGYIDAAYHRTNRVLEGAGSFSDRVFDVQNRTSFVLHQVGLTVAKQPKEGFGGLVNLTVGKDAQVIHSWDDPTGPTSSQFDITQAFGQYASGPLTLMGGKFVTLHGTEVIASTGNTNFSRSILFGSVPFTHTGVRATYAVNDALSLTAGVNNGWDQVKDSNRAKTIELMATITPIKPLTVVLSSMNGKETIPQNTPGNREGTRNSFNAVATFAVNDNLSLGLEGLTVSQEFGTAALTTARYSGWAGYLTYMFTPQWRGVVRAETFDDKDGFRFGTAANVKYNEATLTLSWLPSSSFELRGEYRRDRSNTAVFLDDNAATYRELSTWAVQALYKF